MNVRNVLVVYKKSAYQIYVIERKSTLFVGPKRRVLDWDLRRLKQAHAAHQETLMEVQRVLEAHNVRYRMIHRAMRHDYSPYELVIAVGGDGTFLEAARGVTRQVLFGVNSDPDRSVGCFCRASLKMFWRLFDSILNGGVQTHQLYRMQLTLNGKMLGFSVLNDILVAHENPAAMSRYEIAINGIKEEQRSSGLWICTAAGSTGAMQSAGGDAMPKGSDALQYRPRELYCPSGVTYRLTGHTIPAKRTIRLRSLMRRGMVYVDGEHLKLPFRYGDQLHIRRARYPLRVVDGVMTHT